MKTIELTKNKVAMVDNKNYINLNRFRWFAQKGRKTWYATRACYCPFSKHQYAIGMHRQIMSAPGNKQVDHKNGNGLNNQEYNLRICVNAENVRNQVIHKNNKSGFKGVHWSAEKSKWRARLCYNHKPIHLGYFDDIRKAVLAYNKAARLYFGEFAKLNKVA